MILFDTVTKTYPTATRPALDGVSLEIERGEFVFVVGSSGSGKSTLLRLAIREEGATSGRVLVAGRDLRQLPDRQVPMLRRDIGTVFQDFRLLPNKTVSQNVAFALQVIGKSRSVIRQTLPETLRIVGLSGKEKRLPHQLSGGEQQRVAIARAIVNKPSILLADEPTGNLDPSTSREIVRLLDRINRSGTTVVVATHDHEIVNEFRKRVIELDAGKIVRDEADGTYGDTTSAIPVVSVSEEVAGELPDTLAAESTPTTRRRGWRLGRRRRHTSPGPEPITVGGADETPDERGE
ncbi:MAG: cell division ATP-binding protein FtsE [Actinomycetales bacterium]|nr:MAG: cell division ATP-binding protein FtsE [Actinomycetales bacterium]